jgi:predicted 3-demethylubiquinone-9 3-methyltransferase (glyoxalase superfamily)
MAARGSNSAALQHYRSLLDNSAIKLINLASRHSLTLLKQKFLKTIFERYLTPSIALNPLPPIDLGQNFDSSVPIQ